MSVQRLIPYRLATHRIDSQEWPQIESELKRNPSSPEICFGAPPVEVRAAMDCKLADGLVLDRLRPQSINCWKTESNKSSFQRAAAALNV